MNKVTVAKDALTEVLTQNMDAHYDKFVRAQEIYKGRVIEELEKQLKRARAGDKVSHHINLPMPENHVDDYKTALKMLDFEVDDTVELTRAEFKCFVEDEWGWIESFTSNTASYLE